VTHTCRNRDRHYNYNAIDADADVDTAFNKTLFVRISDSLSFVLRFYGA